MKFRKLNNRRKRFVKRPSTECPVRDKRGRGGRKIPSNLNENLSDHRRSFARARVDPLSRTRRAPRILINRLDSLNAPYLRTRYVAREVPRPAPPKESAATPVVPRKQEESRARARARQTARRSPPEKSARGSIYARNVSRVRPTAAALPPPAVRPAALRAAAQCASLRDARVPRCVCARPCT